MSYILFRYPVKKVPAGFFEDPGTIDAVKTTAGLINDLADTLGVQWADRAIIQGHVEFTGIGLDGLVFLRLFRTKTGSLFTV